MKRVLSLVLALVMVFGTIMPAFAESTDSQAGQDLESYGIIAGDGTGLNEAGTLTRAEMTVILAKLNGKATEAAAYAFESAFTDDADAWYTPWVAYAATQGWMSGYPDNTFKPMNVISAQEVNVLMVKALGYEVEWPTANETAADLGVAVVAADAAKVLRGEIFATLRAALDVNAKDATNTLGTALALTGYVAPAPATPDALEVVSVEAINLIQVQVVFNQEVDADSAEDAGNYEVEDMTVSDAALLADMMTVVLTLSDNAEQQDALDVTVDGVETAEEVALEEVVFEDVAFLDTTIPTVVSAEVVGIDTIKITFSEPMTEASLQAKANYSVDGGDLYINTVEAFNNNTEANITLYSDLEEGDVTVLVKAAVEDTAGFGVVQDTLTATVTEDEDAPVVVSFKDATTTGVTLVFNEEIEIKDVTDYDDWYHTNSNSPVTADVELSSDGKEVTLDFTDNELPEGTAYVYILKETVNDLWDNDNAQIMFKVEITLDETAPEVDSVTVNTEDQIEVEYTEAVDTDMAEEMDNYTIIQDGEEVEDIIEDINYAAKVATIDFSDNLSGDYTIVIKNIEDPAENEMATATVEFEVDDLTAPLFTDFSATVYNSGDADQMIIISFGEEMNAEGNYSVVDPANYTVNGTSLTDLVDDYDAEIALTNNGKSVKITCPIDTSDLGDDANGVDLVLGTDALVIARVADAAGNYTAAYTGEVDIDGAAYVNISEVEVTAIDTVVVTFDDLLGDFEASDLVIEDANGVDLSPAKRSISMDSDGNTVVTIELTTDLLFNAMTDVASPLAVYALVVDEDSTNEFGETLLIGEKMIAVDKISADLYDDDDADVDAADFGDYVTIGTDNTFAIIFNETLDATISVATAGNDFVVKADNDTLTNGVDFAVTGFSNTNETDDTIEFVLLGDYLGFDGEIEVALAATTNFVADAAGNDLADFDTDEFDVANSAAYADAEAGALTEGHYTVASWLVLTNALALDDSTAALITARTTAINDAIADLVFAGQAALDAEVILANAEVEADNTIATWNDLEDALALPETTNAEVVAKQTAINNAIAALETWAFAADAAVTVYEALNLTDDANIASSVAVQAATRLAATDAIAAAVTNGVASATTDGYTTRVTDKDTLITDAITVTTIEITANALANATVGTSSTATTVLKNANGDVLDTALAGDYAVTYAWSVTAATPLSSAVLTDDTTDVVTVTITTANLTATPVALELELTQGTMTPITETANMVVTGL